MKLYLNIKKTGTWYGVSRKLGYTQSEIRILRNSDRFKQSHPDLSKIRKKKRTNELNEFIESLPMDEIILQYRRLGTWKKMRDHLEYSSSVINRLRRSERFRKAYPSLAKLPKD